MRPNPQCPNCQAPAPTSSPSTGEVECPECGVLYSPNPDKPPKSKKARAKKKKGQKPVAGNRNWLLVGCVAFSVLALAGSVIYSYSRKASNSADSTQTPGGDDGANQEGPAFESPPFPPIPWAVPSGVVTAEVPALPDEIATEFPGLFVPGGHGDFLFNKETMQGRGAAERRLGLTGGSVARGCFDPETRRIKETGVLDPAMASHAALWGEYGQQPVVEVSDDRKIALYRPQPEASGIVGGQSPNSKGWIYVWEANKKEPLTGRVDCKFHPWIGWTAKNKLLVLNEKRLTSWDVESGKKAFEFPGTFVGRAVLSPARNWVVVCVEGNYLEVLDSETGACLGRLPGNGQPWTWLHVTGDAKRLVGLQRPAKGNLKLRGWDLATGEVTWEQDQLGDVNGSWLVPAGPGRLVVVTAAGSQVFLVDLDSGEVEGQVRFASKPVETTNPKPNTPNGPTKGNALTSGKGNTAGPTEVKPLPTSPDGRLWWAFKGHVFSVPIPEGEEGEEMLRPGGPTGLSIEANCGDRERDDRVIQAMTGKLKKARYTVAPGGWKVRIAAKHDSTQVQMTFTLGKPVNLPRWVCTLELIAPDNTVLLSRPFDLTWPRWNSRYFVSLTTPGMSFMKGGKPNQQTEHYDFGRVNPEQAMIEETFDNLVSALSAFRPPRTARKTKEGYTIKEREIVLTPPTLGDK